jgi:hypothetical protein
MERGRFGESGFSFSLSIEMAEVGLFSGAGPGFAEAGGRILFGRAGADCPGPGLPLPVAAGFATGRCRALISAFSWNSVILAFRRSSTCSRKGFMARSPTIFMSVPSASAAARRTGSNVSVSNFVHDSPMAVTSFFKGAKGVVRRQRTRNRRDSVLTWGFLCLRPSWISSRTSVKPTYISYVIIGVQQ